MHFLSRLPQHRLPKFINDWLTDYLRKRVCTIAVDANGTTLFDQQSVVLYDFPEATVGEHSARERYYTVARILRRFADYSWDPDDHYERGIRQVTHARLTPHTGWILHESK